MRAGKSVDLATVSFPTQGGATDFFKEMLNRYQPGAWVNDTDSLHLAALLERHTEYQDKVGVGVDHFEVMATQHGTQCFRVIRTDGSGTDFSYLHCIRGRPPSRKQEVSQALREAVRIDLYRARDKFFAEHRDNDGLVACAVTRERIRPQDGHMDHRPPMTFEVIVTTFLGSRGLSLEAVPLTDGADEQVTPTVTDEALVEAFRGWHARMAHLDFVKDTINLAQSSRLRLKPGRIQISGS
jgi:Protein of unknown function (DUF3223)